MNSVQVADETFVAASPTSVAAVVGDRSRWARWWPDLQLDVVEDRGEQGVRWRVAGAVTGTMEIWCRPVLDGFVLHYFLHGEPTSSSRGSARENHRRRVAGRRMSTEVKRRLESGRAAGDPAAGAVRTDGPAVRGGV